jgi:hypothetical protein
LAKSVGAEFGVILVISFWRNEATFVPVWPDWLEFDGSEGVESIQDVLVSHRYDSSLGLKKKLEYFDLQPHIGFAVLVSWCPVKLLENSESWDQKLP